MDIISRLAADGAVRRLCERALARPPRGGGGSALVAHGSAGSSTAFLAAAAARATSRPVVLVVAHLDEADEAVDELSAAGVEALRLPALEALPGETRVSLDQLAERVGVVRRVTAMREGETGVIVCAIQALMQLVPSPERMARLCLVLERGDERGPAAVARWLADGGYRRVEAVEEPGEYAVRGGIMDVFGPGDATGGDMGAGGVPVRLDFFGDALEKISEIDVGTMASDRSVARVQLVAASAERMQSVAASDAGGGVNFLELVPDRAIALLHETLEVYEQARGYYERVTDAAAGSGIIGPPAVIKILRERFAGFAEVNQFSAAGGRAGGAGAARGVGGGGDEVIDLPAAVLPGLSRDTAEAVQELAQIAGRMRVGVFCQNDGELQRLGELIGQFAPEAKGRIEGAVSYMHRGFVWGEGEGFEGSGDRGNKGGEAIAVVPYHELLHRFEVRRRHRGGAGRLRAGRAMDTFLDFGPGDLVVHREHGIGRFVALRTMRPREARRGGEVIMPGEAARDGARKGEPRADDAEEYLTIEFAKAARLHVPATKIDQVQKYVGGFKGRPQLSALGGERWRKQKERVSESVRDLAGELLRVRAAREHLPGIRYPADTAWQKEFEAEFPYEETQDQLAALAEIKRDMQGERPMDRLVCGDVGYGKTELAIRAAFKAVEYGKQVAVLVPTTVLAEQHERTFRSRFADYPFRVESLSRFKTATEVNDTLAALRKGQVDVVIGTHRLLSKDVKFADLGLVVIDEEQRFGVEHKERLLALRMTVDVLTLSATPIPRTLHMSMLGLRDISSLATAPLDRRAVVTEVIPYNPRRIAQAIARELARDGQVFFVHNRVYNIRSVADDVFKLAPGSRLVVGHGQMPDRELESVMLAFMRRQADVLVSTTIIESGIDIPTANTMFINDADRFGLADLHQLRGRVGRYKHRAYCYLLLPQNRTVGQTAVKRLKAIEEFSMLGAGFKIAMRDLEIRGAGNILGPEQSGHITAVGYEMYCQLLERAVKELKGEAVAAPSETAIEIGVTGLIPKAYIPSDQRRMEAYRRLATAASAADLDKVRAELVDAYGEVPAAVGRLLELAELRIGASALEVRSITVREKDVVLRIPPCRAEEVGHRLRSARGTVVVLAPKAGEESSEVYYRPPQNFMQPGTLLTVLRRRLGGDSASDAAGARQPLAARAGRG